MRRPEVVYEDAGFVAVNKPAGLLVHPIGTKCKVPRSRTSLRLSKQSAQRESTLADWLVERYPEMRVVGDDPEMRPGIVHRLDRDTSGLMLVARTEEYFLYLKQLFQHRAVVKTYLALVFGTVRPTHGTIDVPIGIKTGTVRRTLHSKKMAKGAVTRYRVEQHITAPSAGAAREAKKGKYVPGEQRFSLLTVVPETGRTHQIRVHLASRGHAVVGDRTYGPRKQPAWCHRMMLHAFSIEFVAREGQRLKIAVAPPPDLVKSLKIIYPQARY